MHLCDTCGKVFTSRRFLNNHLKTKHNQNLVENSTSFECGECRSQFNRSHNLLKHLRNQHQSPSAHRCFFCSTYFAHEKSLHFHERKDHGLNEIKHQKKRIFSSAPVEFTTKAINDRFKVHRLKIMRTDLCIDPFNYLISNQQNIMDFVNEKLSQSSNLKVGVSIAVKLVKPLTNDDVTAFFNSHFMRLADHITDEEYHVHVDQLMSNLSVYASCGSGWVIDSLLSVEVKTATCQMACGSSYIATPIILKGLSRSLLNIKNKKDNFCFLYCVAAAIFSFIGRPSHPSNHKENVRRLKFNSARMPMPLSSIPTFERSNDVSINVYQLEGRKLVAVYYSKRKSSKRRINLLRLVEGSNSHYCLITNFSNLLQRLTRSESKRKKGSKSKFCSNCFQPIIKKNFRKHFKFCESNSPLEIRMPTCAPFVEFVNWQKTQRVPFIVYADLEAIDVPSNPSTTVGSNTKEIEKQFPCSFGAVLIDDRSKFVSIRFFGIKNFRFTKTVLTQNFWFR